MTTRNAVLISLVVAAIVGFVWTGPMLFDTIEGLDTSAYPMGAAAQALADAVAGPLPNAVAGLVVGMGTLLVLAIVAFFWVRGSARSNVDESRRSFLSGAASGVGAGVGVLAAGGATAFVRAGYGVGEGGKGWANVTGPALGAEVEMTHPNPSESWKGARVQSLRRLGRTEAMISDISAGAGPISGDKGVDIIRAVLDRGVNYVDTAPDYSAHGSEEAVGKAIQGRRDELFIATKFCTPIGHLPTGTPVERYKEVVEGSLSRLGTDWVDLVHVHSVDTAERVLDPNLHEAFDQLKQEGKARFLGFSTHTPNLETVTEAAIASGRFDVMMLAYHHGAWKNQMDLIRRAREEQDMGVVAMKTLKGAKHHGLAGFREQADSYTQAAFKWVLSNPDVSGLVISFRELQHVDEYLFASGKGVTETDLAILEEYDRQIAGTYCAPHCGDCLSSCPEGLPIHDVLRHRMYAEDYGHEKEGISRYAELAKNASVCTGCAAPCQGACPQGIPIQERMQGAHQLLSIS
ncbi:MAG: aldo/keto reductase [Myxococcota bacterium]|nr:aldo/keto reductase [Myxococcota bacterium]